MTSSNSSSDTLQTNLIRTSKIVTAQITRLTMNKKFNSFVHQIKSVFSVSDLTSFEVQEEEYLITKRKKGYVRQLKKIHIPQHDYSVSEPAASVHAYHEQKYPIP